RKLAMADPASSRRLDPFVSEREAVSYILSRLEIDTADDVAFQLRKFDKDSGIHSCLSGRVELSNTTREFDSVMDRLETFAREFRIRHGHDIDLHSLSGHRGMRLSDPYEAVIHMVEVLHFTWPTFAKETKFDDIPRDIYIIQTLVALAFHVESYLLPSYMRCNQDHVNSFCWDYFQFVAAKGGNFSDCAAMRASFSEEPVTLIEVRASLVSIIGVVLNGQGRVEKDGRAAHLRE
ncbi:hypothetical protein PFISCL1PPCAC_4035, partial [Pristionchus fissidentatus]